jgi:hypothetical protein
VEMGHSSTLSLTSALEGVRLLKRHAPAALSPGRDLVSIVQEAGWALGPVSTVAENLTLTELDPQVVQPVTSHNATRATILTCRYTRCISKPRLTIDTKSCISLKLWTLMSFLRPAPPPPPTDSNSL